MESPGIFYFHFENSDMFRISFVPFKTGVKINISNLLVYRTSVIYMLLARPDFHWPAYKMCKWPGYFSVIAKTPQVLPFF